MRRRLPVRCYSPLPFAPLPPCAQHHITEQPDCPEAGRTAHEGGCEHMREGGRVQVLEARSPVTLRKSVKNDAELAGMREAHLRDAEAIVQFLHWLDDRVRL